MTVIYASMNCASFQERSLNDSGFRASMIVNCGCCLQAASPTEGLNGRVFLFPLVAEACIKDCGSPPEFSEVRCWSMIAHIYLTSRL